jgi:hypothetical protein
MTPDEALRLLRLVRYAPRQPSLIWLAAQAGYSHTALYDAAKRDWMTQRMADRLEPAFRRIRVFDGHIVAFFSRPGDFQSRAGGARPGAGRKPRGGARP